MRKKAICKLDRFGCDAIDKIVTAKRYHVSRWLIEGYVEVLQRHRLSVEEVRRLVPIFEMETVCLLLAVKERRWCSVMEHYGSVSEQRLDQYNFIQDVCEVFEEELKQDEEYTAPKNPPPKNPVAILEGPYFNDHGTYCFPYSAFQIGSDCRGSQLEIVGGLKVGL